MHDREKVIKGLEICVDRVPGKYECNECPYEIDGNYCEINLAKDAIALLKEQEKQKFFVDESGKITPLPIVFPNCPLKEYEAVVRCKDCKYAAPDMACSHESEWGNEISRNRGNPDWYCADGERRSE